MDRFWKFTYSRINARCYLLLLFCFSETRFRRRNRIAIDLRELIDPPGPIELHVESQQVGTGRHQGHHPVGWCQFDSIN